MTALSPGTADHCTHRSMRPGSAISLPVVSDGTERTRIKPSKNGKRRAIVLGIVQFLIIAHIVLWLLSKKYGWWGGRTTTPIEPSESMEFVKTGVINAGLIFFAIAMLSTLILGRWFCGWGCHVVLLQDLCGWMMKKVGVRPKQFRSRFLIYVPLLLAIYMFILPAVHRVVLVPLDGSLASSLGDANWLVIGWREIFGFLGFPLPMPNMPAWSVSWHLTTTEFWRTFPGAMVAIPFLFVCGFATVYFLGAKGFCTYGCPYGGFFAPLDKLAPARIVVNDNCEQCGHCTAVCTSNVRVHEEVREYGMVVDPGCMKCLDCVSVCPNEALSFGFAKPAIMKGDAKHEKPKRVYDLTMGEEFGCAIVFVLSFLAVRGVYGAVPMLMAAGLAGIITFLKWKLWRLWRDPNVHLYRRQLKLKGHVKPAGWMFVGAVALVATLTAHSGVVNGALWLAGRADRRVTITQEEAFSGTKIDMPEDMAAQAERALSLYRLASSLGDGGIGLLNTWQSSIDLSIARIHCAKQDFVAAEHTVQRMIERDGARDDLSSSLMWVMHAQQRTEEALTLGEKVLLGDIEAEATLQAFTQLTLMSEQAERLDRVLTERIAKFPQDIHTLRMQSSMLMQNGTREGLEQGLVLRDRVLKIDAGAPEDHQMKALALADLGRMEDAVSALKDGLKVAPESLPLNALIAQMLQAMGKASEAEPYLAKAMKLQQQHASMQQSAPAPAPQSGGSMRQ